MPPKLIKWKSFCGRKEKAHPISTRDKHQFAFVTLLFPNPANKNESPYMVGNISTALGLRRQSTKADLVCLVTPDVDPDTIAALNVVYDRVITVPYLRPHETVINTFRESYLNMFTKLHIFDPRIFPYKKVCFVDSDILPLRNYDAVFDVPTPAGILEPARNQQDRFDFGFGHRCIPHCQHGAKVPHKYTDLWLPEAGDMNAGLWVVSPDLVEFEDMMQEIARPAKEWIRAGTKYAGYFDHDSGVVNYFYTWPEQQYITSRYSGSWHALGYEFASWCINAGAMNGVHYVPFIKMPWLDSYARTKRREGPDHTECLQLYFVVMYEGLQRYPQLLANPRFVKYAEKMLKTLDQFQDQPVTEAVVRFKKEKNWARGLK